MSKRMYADPNITVIYQNNDGVITNPMSDIGNVFFHSDFNYLSIQNKVTTNVTFPSTPANTFNSWSFIRVFDHGLNYKPLVLCHINTLDVPLNGTFVYSMDEGAEGAQIQQFYSASSSTSVGIFYGRTSKRSASLPSFTLNMTFFVFERVL